jgi:hypothetical protein
MSIGLLAGAFESTKDGGQTWRDHAAAQPTPTSMHVLIFDPSQPNIVYAGSGMYGDADDSAIHRWWR